MVEHEVDEMVLNEQVQGLHELTDFDEDDEVLMEQMRHERVEMESLSSHIKQTEAMVSQRLLLAVQ